MEADVMLAATLNPMQCFAAKLFRELPSGFPPLCSLTLRTSPSLVGHTPFTLHLNVIHGSVFDAKLPRINNL